MEEASHHSSKVLVTIGRIFNHISVISVEWNDFRAFNARNNSRMLWDNLEERQLALQASWR